jgi:hypothetical protein
MRLARSFVVSTVGESGLDLLAMSFSASGPGTDMQQARSWPIKDRETGTRGARKQGRGTSAQDSA